jgi:hypothetical protein
MERNLEQYQGGHFSPQGNESEEEKKRLAEANVNITGKGDETAEDFTANYAAMVTGEIDKMTEKDKDKMMGTEPNSETSH